MAVPLFQVGDIMVHSTHGHGQFYVFGKIRKITPTGRLRISYLAKERKNLVKINGGMTCRVYPSSEFGGGNTLVDKCGYKKGAHWLDSESWKKYDPKKEYKEWDDAWN